MKFRDEKDMPQTGGASYVKLKDGEKIHGIFRGDLHEFYAVWKDGKPTEVPEGTPGAGFRFRINFVVKEGSVYVPKVFEQGVTVYKALAELNGIYPLEKTLVQISRRGNSINDTEYTIMPLPQPVSEATLHHLETLELNDLTGGKKKSGHPANVPHDNFGGAPMPDQHDEIPF